MSADSWRGHSQLTGVATLLDVISASERFSQAVQGVPLTSTWHPPPPTDFDEQSPSSTDQLLIDELGIPCVIDVNFPAMLLHRLGSLEDTRKRRDDLFSGKHTFLVNTSGAGKTRLLFEGLCDNWGFYFTSRVDSGFLGSFDIQTTMIQRLIDRTEFVEFPSLLPQVEAEQAAVLNLKLARSHAARILLARMLIFRSFLNRAESSGGLSQEHRRSWLHFQLQPNVQREEEKHTDHLADVFLDISEALLDAEVDDEVIEEAITQTATEIITILGEPARIYLALDEANVAARVCKGSFRDGDGHFYSILKAILKIWRECLKDFPLVFVVAGTEIPQKSFAGDDEWSDLIWSSNTGAFDERKLQEQYVKRFLPNDLWGSIGESLTHRTWRWLRGRHRFTAGYVAVLLEHSYAKPLTYLDMFICQGTGYFPHDVHYDVRPPKDIVPFSLLDFTAMIIDKQLRSYVHLALMDALVSTSNPGYPSDSIKLVNQGMGRFTDSRCAHIVVDEPLVIARAVTWFNSDEGEAPASILKYRYFVEHLVDPDMAPRHPPAYLAFALALSLSKSRRISDIFSLSRPAPSWSRRNADIAVRTVQDDDYVVEHPVRDVDNVHQTLVTYSTSSSETLKWLRHGSRTPFCIHVTDTAATLLFIVKLSNGSRFWAIMRVLHSLADDEDITTRIRDTLHDLQPENLFQNPVHEPSSDILEALDSLPNICSQVGAHGILPVIAVLGKDADRDILATPGLPRVALLNLNEISRAMDLIPSEKVAARIVDAVTRDPGKAEKQPEVAEEATRPKGRKGKARAAASNPSGPKRTRGSSLIQHDADSSGPHDQSSKGSRYNLRPRAKRITR